MEKSKKHYWAVSNSEGTLFEGTFNQCWKWFTTNFSELTVGYLAECGTHIGRIN